MARRGAQRMHTHTLQGQDAHALAGPALLRGDANAHMVWQRIALLGVLY